MLVDVPVRNDDGTVKFNITLNDEQLQAILGFAVNFLIATGLSATLGIPMPSVEEDTQTRMFDD